MIRLSAALLFSVTCLAAPEARAQTVPMVSQCIAVANAMPQDMNPVVVKAAFATPVQAAAPQVTIRYAGHSTFIIESKTNRQVLVIPQ